MSQSFLVALHM